MVYSVQQTTMLQGIERYMKQAIVDKVSSVSSSALVSSLVSHPFRLVKEIVHMGSMVLVCVLWQQLCVS